MTPRYISNQLVDARDVVKEKVNGLTRSMSEKMDDTRCAAAGGLDRTAAAVHGGGDKFAGLAHSTADKISLTAKYVRKHDFKYMMADAGRTIKKNPATSLLVAGVIVFSVGRALRNTN
jgi:hypothetical protein